MSDKVVTRVLAGGPGVAVLAEVPVRDDLTNRWCELENLRMLAIGAGSALLTSATVEWTNREEAYSARATTVLELPAGKAVPFLDQAMLRHIADAAYEVHYSGGDLSKPAAECTLTFHVLTGHAEVALPLVLRVRRSADDQVVVSADLKR